MTRPAPTMLCYLPNPTDATSLYRAVGPLQALRRRGVVNLTINAPASWALMKSADLVFLQRPALDDHRRIVDLAKANRKPVWIDYDDDLFRIPLCNRAHRVYSKPDVQKNMVDMIAKADVVTVSTEALKELVTGILRGLAGGGLADEALDEGEVSLVESKVVVVPNAYDEELLRPLRDAPLVDAREQAQIVSWRGSGTHDKDLAGVTRDLCRVVEERLQWTYCFVGEPFWWTIECLREVKGAKETNIFIAPTMDPIEFFGFWSRTRPAVVVVPLDDEPFNHCKSNIAWLEATHAGAVVVAPDMPEWRRPGVTIYGPGRSFHDALASVMAMSPDDRAALHHLSATWIANNLTLDLVNTRRAAIINALSGRTSHL